MNLAGGKFFSSRAWPALGSLRTLINALKKYQRIQIEVCGHARTPGWPIETVSVPDEARRVQSSLGVPQRSAIDRIMLPSSRQAGDTFWRSTIVSIRLIRIYQGGVHRASVWSGATEPPRIGSDAQTRGYLVWQDARNCASSDGLRFCTRRRGHRR
jgi:hypothetical protein